jgi:hypothetical protein
MVPHSSACQSRPVPRRANVKASLRGLSLAVKVEPRWLSMQAHSGSHVSPKRPYYCAQWLLSNQSQTAVAKTKMLEMASPSFQISFTSPDMAYIIWQLRRTRVRNSRYLLCLRHWSLLHLKSDIKIKNQSSLVENRHGGSDEPRLRAAKQRTMAIRHFLLFLRFIHHYCWSSVCCPWLLGRGF